MVVEVSTLQYECDVLRQRLEDHQPPDSVLNITSDNLSPSSSTLEAALEQRIQALEAHLSEVEADNDRLKQQVISDALTQNNALKDGEPATSPLDGSEKVVPGILTPKSLTLKELVSPLHCYVKSIR